MTPSKPPAGIDAAAAFAAWLEALLPIDGDERRITGIGARRREQLRDLLGPAPRRRDALLAVPRRIEDLRAADDLAELVARASAEGASLAFRFKATSEPRRQGRGGVRLDGEAGDERIRLLWFKRTPARLLAALSSPDPVLVYGLLRRDPRQGLVCVHPRLPQPSDDGRLIARYDKLDRRAAAWLQSAVGAMLDDWPLAATDPQDDVSGAMAAAALRRVFAVLHGLVPGDVEAARRELAAIEWRAFRLRLEGARDALCVAAEPLAPGGRLVRALVRRLPFAPTPSQAAAHGKIRTDLAREQAMIRLVNGDVGSGKTLVAAMAAADVVECGRQVVVAAPSESLAEQHARTFDGWLRPLGVDVALLTGSVPARARRPLLAALRRGTTPLVVGTHALLEEQVVLDACRLVVIDEQQRFGVAQRQRLLTKGAAPHRLVLTATPIPRTLALMLDGTVAVSRLEPRPGTGGNVVTRAVGMDRLDEVVARLERVLATGARAFWISPSIDDGEHATGARTRARAFAARIGDRVGLVTGRMERNEREAVLQAFAVGTRPLLVATTVVEVGIDVPDASIIVVERAERFGLAQLHQLRGRVGRAGQPASCLLLHDLPLSAEQHGRLDLLRTCHDGLVLAEADLARRGAGDLLGVRQSGVASFRFVDLAQDGAWLASLSEPAAGGMDPRLWFVDQSTTAGGFGAG